MKNWFYALIPPRPTFPDDMKEPEAEIMREHVAYWIGNVNAGKAVLFGPVRHPRADFGGLGVLALDDDEDPNSYGRSDPAIRADVGFSFECLFMPQLVQRT